MNTPPAVTFKALVGLSPIIRCGATVVLTLKNFVGGKAKFDDKCKIVRNDLAALVDNMVVIRLMTGGVQERTVVGRWSKSCQVLAS